MFFQWSENSFIPILSSVAIILSILTPLQHRYRTP